MLPKRQRLTGEELRALLGKKRTVFRAPPFSIACTRGAPAKVAVVVSKKVGKTSVRRNYLRRRIFHEVSRIGLPPCRSVVYLEQAPGSPFPNEALASLLKKAQSAYV